MSVPYRRIRARHDDRTITVYQAYDRHIADPAVAAGRFVPPFKRDRMTWIKPSFRWMMYRCGWATKPGQSRVLAIALTREGFDWALANAALSHPTVGEDRSEYRRRLRTAPVRVQWDPERDPAGRPLDHRSIQIGLSGEAVDRYLAEWTVSITDITERVTELDARRRSGEDIGPALPVETGYPVDPAIAVRIELSDDPGMPR